MQLVGFGWKGQQVWFINLCFYALRCNVDLLFTSCFLIGYDKVNIKWILVYVMPEPAVWKKASKTCNESLLSLLKSILKTLTHVFIFFIAGSWFATVDWDKIPSTWTMELLVTPW